MVALSHCKTAHPDDSKSAKKKSSVAVEEISWLKKQIHFSFILVYPLVPESNELQGGVRVLDGIN